MRETEICGRDLTAKFSATAAPMDMPPITARSTPR